MNSETNGLFPGADWYGLVVDNRRLFDALQDGWLRPAAPETGLLIGVDSFVRKPPPENGNRIPVWIRMDKAKLPDIEVGVLDDNNWHSVPQSQVGSSESCVFWPGVLPTFAIRELSVTSEEHRARLVSMARLASNIAIPDIVVANPANYPNKEIALPSDSLPKPPSQIPDSTSENSIRGAMTMALWAVPRTDPWMDLLVASLSSNEKRLTRAATAVSADWWRFPPWPPWTMSSCPHKSIMDGAQGHLWLAASKVFESHANIRPSNATDRIAEFALLAIESRVDRGIIEEWHRETREVLAADRLIHHDNWKSAPVGLAIQLVLTRPDPVRFKTWLCEDEAPKPPSVAWTAATLCGLWHGFRKLDTRFRGPPRQQEMIAIQAKRACSKDSVIQWPGVTKDDATWRKDSGKFVLTWAGRDFTDKNIKQRGQWYSSNFNDPAVRRDALEIAKRFDWPCVSRVVSLSAGTRSWNGSGALESADKKLRIQGSIQLRLSPNDSVDEEVDRQSFLRLMSIEPGRLPGPPASMIDMRPADDIPGFKLIPEFLSEDEEGAIVAEIDRSPWNSELRRRVQHYGWRYDYKSKQVNSSMRIDRLPKWAESIAKRLFESSHVPEMPDQVIVNEYVRDQGIAPHIDSPSSFADGVAMISLLETWEMEFRKQGGKTKVTRRLDQRSAAILTGEARYQWKHGIPKRKSEPGSKSNNGKTRRIPRKRRISLTFRKVIEDSGMRMSL